LREKIVLDRHLAATVRSQRIEKFGPILYGKEEKMQWAKKDLVRSLWAKPTYRQAVVRAQVRFYESFTFPCVVPEFWCR
jgi:hypothetical protein